MYEDFDVPLLVEGIEGLKKLKLTFFPIPYFFPRVLFNMDSIPLPRIMHIFGTPGSLKSTFAAEICRWFAQKQKQAVILDTEGKAAFLAYQGLLGQYMEHVQWYTVTALDNWVEYLLNYLQNVQKQLEKGKRFSPHVIVIDSVLGSNTIQTTTTMTRLGGAQNRFAAEAKNISDFLRSFVSRLNDVPLLLIFINHKKERPDRTGIRIIETPLGGKAIRTYSGFEFDLTKIRGDVYAGGYSECDLNIRVEKNSFGPENLEITIPVIFDRGQVVFDWHSALVYWLESLSTQYIKFKITSEIEQKIRSLFDVSVRSGGRKGKLYYCDSIGITSDKAMPASELGKYIEENCKKEVDLLERVLGIHKFVNEEESKNVENFQH